MQRSASQNYNVGELVLRLPDKKNDKLKPKWEGPFIIDQVLTDGAYRLRNSSDNDWSRTHGMQPVSEDSTPSAGLCVCLLPLSIFYTLAVLYFSPSPSLSLTAVKGSFAPCSHTIDALSALIIPGGFFNRSLFIQIGRASCRERV